MAAVLATFALMGAAFGVACIAQPRKGARAAVVIALMATALPLALYTRGLGYPHPPIVQTAVNYVHGVGRNA
jgi:hypothetical protein